MRKMLPRPTRLSTDTRPPCAWAMWVTIAGPMPSVVNREWSAPHSMGRTVLADPRDRSRRIDEARCEAP